MKIKTIILLIVTSTIFSCTSNEKKSALNKTEDYGIITSSVKFDEVMFYFGKIKAGKIVKHTYHFRNVGEKPLILSDVYTSCGCTVPSFSKIPIPPGGQSDIVVILNTANQTGVQQKSITVISNSEPSTTEIYMTGEVLSDKFKD